MQKVDTRPLLQQLHAELVLAAVPAGRIGERRFGVAGVFDELLERLDSSSGLTDSMNWLVATLVTGKRSLRGSKLSFE